MSRKQHMNKIKTSRAKKPKNKPRRNSQAKQYND